MLARLVEVLLIEALRSTPGDDAPPGLLRGLADARLAPAIRQMHGDPARSWTVPQLAKTAALSRSAFFERFTRTVGVPPMEYLLAWRMAVAKDLLRRQESGSPRWPSASATGRRARSAPRSAGTSVSLRVATHARVRSTRAHSSRPEIETRSRSWDAAATVAATRACRVPRRSTRYPGTTRGMAVASRGLMNIVIDRVARDVRYACRQLLRAPLAALTIVVTVGLGLGLVAAVYTILNAMVFRVDEVRNPHELFSVERQRSAIAEAETFTTSEYEALLRETDVFTDAFASTGDVSALIEGVRREGRLVTGNFSGMLGVGAERGRALDRRRTTSPAALPCSS